MTALISTNVLLSPGEWTVNGQSVSEDLDVDLTLKNLSNDIVLQTNIQSNIDLNQIITNPKCFISLIDKFELSSTSINISK